MTPALIQPLDVMRTFLAHDVPCVVTGSVAAVAHGSPLPLRGTDIVVSSWSSAIRDAVDALGEEAPPAPHEEWCASTAHGPVRVIASPGRYARLRRTAELMNLGVDCEVLVTSVRDLIVECMNSPAPEERALIPALEEILALTHEE